MSTPSLATTSIATESMSLVIPTLVGLSLLSFLARFQSFRTGEPKQPLPRQLLFLQKKDLEDVPTIDYDKDSFLSLPPSLSEEGSHRMDQNLLKKNCHAELETMSLKYLYAEISTCVVFIII